MAKEKKAPKVNSDGLMSKEAETILIGLMISLIAIIGLLNRGPIGEFLTFCFVYLFGVFYFVAYLIILFFGLYLTLKRKAFRVQIDVTLLGMILLFIGIIIAASPGNGDELRLSNVFSKFSAQMNNISQGVLIPNVAGIEQAGGGLIGYFLAALLNTTITSVGTIIVSFILMIAGVVLCLYRPSLKIKGWLKKRKERKKAKQEALEKERKLAESELEEALDIQEEEEKESLSYVSSDPENCATKARFVLASEGDKTSDILADDIEEDNEYDEPKSSTAPSVFADELEPKNDTPIISEHPEATVPTASKVSYRASAPFEPPVTVTINKNPTPKEKGNYDMPPYVYPSLELLNVYENTDVDEENNVVALERQKAINELFGDFGIGATISGYKIGPSVTRFDVLMNRDVSVNIVDKYINDISARLGGVGARFEKIVRGKVTSGLEIPNAKATTVSLKECLAPFINDRKYRYFVPFGKDITGDIIGVNVTNYPHLLVAGSTGSGKSVFMHCLIMSLLMKASPAELRIMLIDPKRVEMSMYRDIPHLLCPIISDYDQSKVAMNRLVMEMENRYTMFEQVGVSKISQYNEYAEEEHLEPMPLIIVVIDEYADLVENCKDIGGPVVKLAAKSRACGIHLVISTQRPSVDVITGVIKANLPTRVALRVAKAIDSQTILGEGGAEKLLGYGDMLVDCQEIPGIGFTRLQSPYVDNKEIRRVVSFLKEHYPTNYNPNFLDLTDRSAAGPAYPGSGGTVTRDDRYEEVKAFVMDLDEVSISEIQRKMGLGFPKAARIMDQLEEAGVVSKPTSGSNRRKVLIHNQSALEESDDKDDKDA